MAQAYSVSGVRGGRHGGEGALTDRSLVATGRHGSGHVMVTGWLMVQMNSLGFFWVPNDIDAASLNHEGQLTRRHV